MYDNYVVASHTDTDILMCHIYIFMHTHSKGFWTAQRVHDLVHLTCLLYLLGLKTALNGHLEEELMSILLFF